MYLPPNALYCIDRLEQAGFACYAVGGCVRDALLGLVPHDYDLCTAAPPDTVARLFAGHTLVRSGERHGTIGVVIGGECYEITTFRREGGYRDVRHPDWVSFVSDIQEDLARRDFTVNAIAWSPTRGYADPFGGQEDLRAGVLRAVGEPRQRFCEDALRVLRGARFAVRYGLQVEAQTMQAMCQCAPELEKLAPERIFEELCKLLPLVTAADLCRFSPVLLCALPELSDQPGFDQKNPHHRHDLFTHTARTVQAVPPEPTLRWAALLHDVAKPACFSPDGAGIGHFYGHAEAGAAMAEEILRRLRAPNALRERVCLLIRQHMTPVEPTRPAVRRRLNRIGAEALRQLLQLQQADMLATGTEESCPSFDRVRELVDRLEEENACLTVRDLALSGHDLLDMGYRGAAIGRVQRQLLELVLEEKTENTAAALTAALSKPGFLPQEDGPETTGGQNL